MNHCLIFGMIDNHRSAGAHRIATHLRQKNWDAEVIDFAVRWTLPQLKELVKSRVTSNTKFFGFSFIFNRVPFQDVMVEFIDWVKEAYPYIVLISGSQSALYNTFNKIDYHIIGYGELGLDALLSWLFSNGEKPKFDFSFSSNHTKVITTLHTYPAYPYPNAIIKYESRDFYMPHEMGQIEFSRGCKFKCKFCNFPILGVRGDYTRDIESTYEQLMYNYDNFGITDYSIADETFNDYTEKITKFADVIEKLPWKPFMSSFIRADLLVSRKQDREELLRMGITAHYYGVETFNEKAGKYIGKGMNPDRLKEGLIEVKNFFKGHVGHRYKGTIALIAGLPGETKDSLEQSKQWLKANWLDQVVTPHVLEIHKEKGSRNSVIDSEYESLGYREIINDNDRMIKELGEAYSVSEFGVGVADDVGFFWENDNMSIYDAIKWTYDVQNKTYAVGNVNIMKPSALNLAKLFCEKDGTVVPLDKRLMLRPDEQRVTLGDNFSTYLNNYISRKLSI